MGKRDIAHELLMKERKKCDLHVKKGDEVLVIAGDDKKKKGTVVKVLKKKEKVVVSGVNSHKKVVTNQDGTKGFVSVEFPIHVSNVKVLSSHQHEKGKKTNKKVVVEKA